MKVLVLWPPQLPSYFNAGHHIQVFATAAHLRRYGQPVEVTARDLGVLNVNWKEIGDVLYSGAFDCVAVANDYDAVDELRRFVHYVRVLSPRSRVITFGRVSSQIPRHFFQYGVDAVVASGDVEAGVLAYVNFLRTGALPPGVWYRDGERLVEPRREGVTLSPSEWALPDVGEIPYDDYSRMYADDSNKFCGIPGRRELVVPAARGCPVGCSYCEVPEVFGRQERRLTVDQVVAYVADSWAKVPFEYVAFYAPTFTLRRSWVLDLASEFQKFGTPHPWKCATTLHHLDEDLLHEMGKSGCVRVSVGLETLETDALEQLPAVKRKHHERLADVARWCSESGIELNCFVVVGLPGTTLAGTQRTIEEVRRLGGRVRPTVYAPYHTMREDMTPWELSLLNRQFLSETDLGPDELHAAYGFLFRPETRLTAVMDRIPIVAN